MMFLWTNFFTIENFLINNTTAFADFSGEIMAKLIRSARGEVIDFELMAIKQQLASAPVPKVVEQRKQAIDEKDGIRTTVTQDSDFLAMASEAAAVSASTSTQGKQLNKK